MKINVSNMPLLELPSEPYDRGIVHGEALRGQIRSNFEEQARVILSSPAARQRGLASVDDYLRFAERYITPIQAYSPTLYREIEGIAAGASLSLQHIVAMNCHLEMIDVANRAAPDPLPDAGCTAFDIKRSARQECLLWQTYDLNRHYQDAAVVIRTNVGELSVACLTFAGTLAASGFNSSGTGIVINKLYGKDARAGVPFCVVLRAALEQPTPGRTISMIVGAERASSINYLVGDAVGILYPLETSACEWDLTEPAGNLFAHTNHFVSPRLQDLECRDFRGFNAHTIVRLMRARQLLQALGPDADRATYMRTMEDKHNFPLSISCQDADGILVKTVATVFFDLAANEAWFSGGNSTSV
jgi:isopenicillin-N N-acyltransferase-like protein